MEEKKKNWFVRHKILTGVLVVVVVIVLLGALGGSSTTDTTLSSNETAQTREVKKAEQISVTELADDFDSNQVAAEKKWEGKFVEFSAEVSNITDSGISFHNVSSKEFSLTQISCRIKDKNQLLNLKNGETATVKGVVGKQTIGVVSLSDCEVVQ